MIDKKNILAMSKAVFRKGQGYPDRRLIHPNREWVIGLMFFVIVILVGGIVATKVFSIYSNVDTQAGEVTNTIPVYHEKITKEALELYGARTVEFARLQANKVARPVVEESLEEVEEVSTTTEEADRSVGAPVLQ